MNANRAMVLTPAGVGAIAVVRLTGPSVRIFLERHFSKVARPGRCVHGDILDGPRVLDDAVVVILPDQDAADVNLHGGAWVVSSFLKLLRREDFDIIERGDGALPLEAVEGQSILEREVLAYLPLARTRQALQILLNQPRAWRDYLKNPPNGPAVGEILADRALYWLLNPPRVAIVGATNVGKSTLANQLFAQERSITANIPGTTRDWVGEEANLDGLLVTLVDTPGVRDTSDAIEQLAIERSAEQVRLADLVVLVLDASRELEGEQTQLLARHADGVRVVNKIDIAQGWAKSLPADARTVATTGEGVDELRRQIRRRFNCEEFDLGRPRWWTQRQADALKRGSLDEFAC